LVGAIDGDTFFDEGDGDVGGFGDEGNIFIDFLVFAFILEDISDDILGVDEGEGVIGSEG
jgi:hypothetical protein